MFRAFHPTRPTSLSTACDDPYVDQFRFEGEKQSNFVFPFEMMTYCMLFFILMGFFFAFYKDNTSVSAIVIWMQCVFAPFYLPGLYHYYQYLARDRHTEVELDSRQGLIKYSNLSRKENILFHISQVQRCEVNCSLLFPYKIDRLTLGLEGGREIHVSGLIMSPIEVLERFDLSYEVRHRWFNAAPKEWPKEQELAA